MINKYKKFEPNAVVLSKLVKTTYLIGKVNSGIGKMKNPYILTYILEGIDSISSNEIENVHTTVDEASNNIINKHPTPFFLYREALKTAHKSLIANEIIRVSNIITINSNIRGQNIGLRKTPIKIKNKNKVIHEGVDANRLLEELGNLIQLINEKNEINPVIKALLIHHYFEWIHPFTDGNGRTGRIIFAILLAKFKILDIPASVFSYSISKTKKIYYSALKDGDNNNLNSYLSKMMDILNDSLTITISIIDEMQSKIAWLKSLDEIQSSKRFLMMIDHFFAGIKVSNKYLVKKTGLNNKTISKYISILVKLNCAEIQRVGVFAPYKNLLLEKIIHKYFSKLD